MTDFAARRQVMVDTQVRPVDVTRFPVIEAMLAVPREVYVPAGEVELAYIEDALDLGEGRVILEPRSFAKMLGALDLGAESLVLDIGAGLGYSAAVMARMVAAVVAVEDHLARDLQRILPEQGVDNVIVVDAPLDEGAPQHGPYDAMIIEGGVEQVPPALTDQLREGGRIAAIFMEGALGVARIGHKIEGQITWRYAFNASAPVLPGFHKTTEFAL
ncbi:protein-L-isoaspartate O-methyltransferase family protein [Poseidonocella sedimentorum]|uniref:Protein-L-isoaspartate O-methyltransferase n=1 Tax=Poseidonocella sedimentorum TaxID=871652 RepID=A0A1I6DD27_9RHOB|nr:protein-L-isoaspartate O-methyltransferase [Poseidonocella sedimentorum]SFR03344.1 protein-L-isoaspartate(D-aspartate) O-methyltransferase [Poseidonocella sedimentorum]